MAHSIYPRFFTRSLKTLSPLCDLIHIPFLSFSRHLSFYLSASSVFSSSYIRIRKVTEARTLIFLFFQDSNFIFLISLSRVLSFARPTCPLSFSRRPREYRESLLRSSSARIVHATARNRSWRPARGYIFFLFLFAAYGRRFSRLA